MLRLSPASSCTMSSVCPSGRTIRRRLRPDQRAALTRDEATLSPGKPTRRHLHTSALRGAPDAPPRTRWARPSSAPAPAPAAATTSSAPRPQRPARPKKAGRTVGRRAGARREACVDGQSGRGRLPCREWKPYSLSGDPCGPPWPLRRTTDTTKASSLQRLSPHVLGSGRRNAAWPLRGRAGLAEHDLPERPTGRARTTAPPA
jgi:hypothetical protein